MHLDFTPEQKELRAEIRASLETVMTPERIAAVAGRMEGGDAVKECVRALGEAHLLGVGWPKEYGGRGFTRARAVHLLRGGAAGERAHPAGDAQHGRADARGLRHRGTEAEVPARDPGRHRRVRDRLLRTRRGKRSGVAAHHRCARRRRLRHQRPEDVHQRRRIRRLHLARGAHGSDGQEAQGHNDLHRADLVAGLLVQTAAHHARRIHVLHVLRRRAGARQRSRGRRERGLAADHHAAELRACRAGQHGRAGAAVREDAELGADHRTRRRSGHRPAVGAAGAGPGRSPGRRLQDHEPARQRGDVEGRARDGRGLGGQGLRHRAHPTGGPRTARGAGPQRNQKG